MNLFAATLPIFYLSSSARILCNIELKMQLNNTYELRCRFSGEDPLQPLHLATQASGSLASRSRRSAEGQQSCTHPSELGQPHPQRASGLPFEFLGHSCTTALSESIVFVYFSPFQKICRHLPHW
mmetsp:Transcript_28944/g.56615  ORF Transcript_28944/g.56615 Transcript_28944/m.56615 type:complete len:125 (+) Transcript_28944:204-578(+)